MPLFTVKPADVPIEWANSKTVKDFFPVLATKSKDASYEQKKNLDLDIPKGPITQEISYAHTNNVKKENLKEEIKKENPTPDPTVKKFDDFGTFYYEASSLSDQQKKPYLG